MALVGTTAAIGTSGNGLPWFRLVHAPFRRVYGAPTGALVVVVVIVAAGVAVTATVVVAVAEAVTVTLVEVPDQLVVVCGDDGRTILTLVWCKSMAAVRSLSGEADRARARFLAVSLVWL
jgi:hypothetical protein